MAQVKFKHGTVKNSRHVVKNLVSASLAMLRTINKDDLNETGEINYSAAKTALHGAQKALIGQPGLSQEEQTSRLAEARDLLSEARKYVVATQKAHKEQTSHQANMYESVVATIDEARQHVTAGRQFAKDRRFVPKDVEQPDEDSKVADVLDLMEEKDQGLG